MREKKIKISINAVRKANIKLVNNYGNSINVLTDNTKNGNVSFKAAYLGKTYNLNISKNEIKDAYAKSLKETISL